MLSGYAKEKAVLYAYKGKVMKDSELGLKVREIRTSLGWNQSYLAEKSGLTGAAISKIETMNVDVYLSTLRKLANGFGLTINDLVGYDEEQLKSAFAVTPEYTASMKLKPFLELNDGDYELCVNLAMRLLEIKLGEK